MSEMTAAVQDAEPDQPKRQRRKRNKMTFTELGLVKLRPPKDGQVLYWDGGDDGQRGLSVLMSAGGTKTYRATFMFNGKVISDKLGRVGEMGLAEARDLTKAYRVTAAKGIDPRPAKRADKDAAASATAGKQAINPASYGAVVDRFIEEYAKPRQRTWKQTEHCLKKLCAAWLDEPFKDITKQQARDLLQGFIRDGHGRKAGVTLSWLKTLWRWASGGGVDLVEAPLMDTIKIEYEEGVRELYFDDHEVKAIWTAADQLGPVEGAYVKLLLLLAPRKNELAGMRRRELDDASNPTLWTTPHERTKSTKKLRRSKNGEPQRRVYLTPLPPLAQRILKRLPKFERRGDDDLMFPGRHKGKPLHPGTPLLRKLVNHGAPADFYPHAVRHTVATWLKKQGHSEWERGLVLNHSETGVTAGYSHGHPVERKRELLEKWAAHVERLVQPDGAALLG